MMDHSGKRMLLLGGLAPNVDIAKRMRERGIYTIVADYLPDSPAKAFANETSMLSVNEVDEIVALCKEKHVDGILHGSCGFGERFYAQICEKLGLPCLGTYEQARIFGNKELFKEKCLEYGIPVIKTYEINDAEDAAAFDAIEYPVVVKPADSSGSKGISMCRTKEELRNAVNAAKRFASEGRLIVEKHMSTEHFSTSVCIQNGKAFSYPHDRLAYRDRSGFDSITHILLYPSKYSEMYFKTTGSQFEKMFADMKFDTSNLFISTVLSEDKKHFLPFDPGFRFMGCQEYIIVEKAWGINLIDMCIDYALTGKLFDEYRLPENFYTMNGKKLAAFCIIAGAGKIAAIDGLDALRADPAVFHISEALTVGDEITAIGTTQQTVVRVHLCCDTKEEMLEAVKRICTMLSVKDEHGNEMLWPGYSKETYWTEGGVEKWLVEHLA